MKRLLSLFCICLFCVALVSCSSKEKGELFKYDIETDPVNLDPQSADDYSSLLVIQNVFEGLLTINEEGKLSEGVATDWEASDNGLQYTFILRKDACWSNGTKVTADDFVFAFRRLFTSSTNAPRASDFFCIKNSKEALKGQKKITEIGVTAEGDYRLVFTLEYPNAMFLQLLTTAPAMPCNESFFYETKGKYGLEAKTWIEEEEQYLVLCNGPFYLKAWEHDNYLAMRRNQHYRGRKEVAALGVNFEIYQQPNQNAEPQDGEPANFDEYRLQQFLDGKTDAVIMDGQGYAQHNEIKNNKVQIYENTTWGILFNLKDSPFQNRNIRKALFYLAAPDLYSTFLTGNTVVAEGIVPKSITMLDQNFRDYAGTGILPQYNVQRAKDIYQKGMDELQKSYLENISMLVTEQGNQEALFGALSQTWQKELGFYAGVEVVSVAEMEKRVKKGEFSCAFYPLSSTYNSPDSVLNSFVAGSGNNYAGYSNKNYDAYVSNGLKSFDMTKSADNFKNAERLLIEDGVFLPLYSVKEYFVQGKTVKGILFYPQSKLVSFAYGIKK